MYLAKMYFRFESHTSPPDFSPTETNVRYTTLQWCPETLWRTACKSTADGHRRIRIWCCTVCRWIQSLCKKKYISWRVHSFPGYLFHSTIVFFWLISEQYLSVQWIWFCYVAITQRRHSICNADNNQRLFLLLE
jgi:hypothetical protein